MKARLTPRHQAFVTAYIENGGDATAAYRSAGYTNSFPSQAACALLKRPLIQEALTLAGKQAQAETGLTAEAVTRKFLDLRGKAEKAGQVDAAIRANIELAKIARVYEPPSDSLASKVGNATEVAASLVATVLEAILPVLTAHNVPAEPIKQALLAKFSLQTDRNQPSSLH